jgi:4-amino-4-deoxy-L-arabinose transferase-like glycosyltransferase
MRAFRGLLVLGVLLRLVFVLLPGTAIQPVWSGGGDTGAYLALAQNLLHGRGYTYSGQPTAFRPPLYPLLLAACIWVSSGFWPVVLRLFQFLLGLGTVLLGAKAAGKLWGARVGRAATLLLLWCPTLVYPTSTVATETLGAFLVAAVFYFAAANLEENLHPAVAGASVGLATLARQVAPVLEIPFVVLYARRRSPRALALVLLGSAVVVSPWALRNYRVFGLPTLSTFGGYNLLRGLVEPQGRSQPGQADRVRRILGWDISVYERNGRGRSYPVETALDATARETWLRLVRLEPARFFEILPAKLSWFWLGSDILLHDNGLRREARLGRAAMVFVWWGYLLLAAFALARLWRQGERGVFWLFVGWFALVTAAHLPFCMNTRLRLPFVDALVAILAARSVASTRLGRRWLAPDDGAP